MTELIRSLANGERPRPKALLVPLALVVLLALAGFAVAALAGVGPLAEGPRTIEIVARDMKFVVPGSEVVNPRIAVARGERVRFVLRNLDPGMAHDLALPSLGARSKVLRESGTETELLLRMPESAGEHEYRCSFHAVLMRGVVDVK